MTEKKLKSQKKGELWLYYGRVSSLQQVKE